MIRIIGVDLPNNKRIIIALTYMFGIGYNTSKKILMESKIDSNTRTHNISEDDIARIRNVIMKSYRVEGDLKKEISLNIKRLIDVNCYKGLRHRKGLTVRGQKTHSNAKTCRKYKKK